MTIFQTGRRRVTSTTLWAGERRGGFFPCPVRTTEQRAAAAGLSRKQPESAAECTRRGVAIAKKKLGTGSKGCAIYPPGSGTEAELGECTQGSLITYSCGLAPRLSASWV